MASGDLIEHARSLLAGNAYLTLGTVGSDGRPWTSPVYFAADGIEDYYWVSGQQSRHSRHIAANPSVSLVVFDSTVRPYHGRALYAAGTAHEVDADGLDRGLQVYPGPATRGAGAVSAADLSGAEPWRLYRAHATEVWVLCPRAPRQACPLHGRTDDHRELVHPSV